MIGDHMTRPVTVFEWWRPKDSKYDVRYEKREIGDGKFHQFSTDYEEFQDGAGNYAVARRSFRDDNALRRRTRHEAAGLSE